MAKARDKARDEAREKSKFIWRTKYPWTFVFYILIFGLLRGFATHHEKEFGLNLLMIAAFMSYIFMYVFYLYGVRPDELEYWHKKYKKRK
jgi:hypothetical protein